MSRFGIPNDTFIRFEQEQRMCVGIENYRRNSATLERWYAVPLWWRWTVWLALAIEARGRCLARLSAGLEAAEVIADDEDDAASRLDLLDRIDAGGIDD